MTVASQRDGGADMQLTYEQMDLVTDDELAPEETRNIPFFGFVTGTLISLGLWSAIAWTVWAVLD
jgi:hypothetical protein